MSKINYNGRIFPDSESLFNIKNRAWRYGEGLIETMLWHKGNIPLYALHAQRLQQSLDALGFPQIDTDLLFAEIKKTVLDITEAQQMIRVQFFRNDNTLEFVIECMPVEQSLITWNDKGLSIGIAKSVTKSSDGISHLKSTSRLNYIVAKKEAEQNSWDDALLLNQYGRIAESTISNVFIIKDNEIITPPLAEGCIAGIMRRYLLDKETIAGMPVHEKALDIAILLNADEIFLTNAIRGIQPVSRYNNKAYPNALTRKVFDEFGFKE